MEPNAYDAVEYPSLAYPDTHPDALAVMGVLHGMSPQSVEHCRVLEIGCNEGANLIPMAYALPHSDFVGFDLAALPVERAQKRIQAMSLSNVNIFQADLMHIPDDLGTFHYIIAHGVYAWVPEPVRDGLLSLCSKHLAANGIAFISYNTMPGGYIRNLLADFMALPTMLFSDDQSRRASTGIDFIQRALSFRNQNDPLRLFLEAEIETLRRRDPAAVFHDELSSEHRPVSFTDFVKHATTKGLQYISEPRLPSPLDPSYKAEAVTMAREMSMGDPILEEQILDYVRIRLYRESLLCHSALTTSIHIRPEAFKNLLLASQASESQGTQGDACTFTLPSGIQIESTHKGTITFLRHLEKTWPLAVPFAELEKLLAQQGAEIDANFMDTLHRLLIARMIEVRTWNPPLSPVIAERPRASAVSRQEASVHSRITTLLHTTLNMEDAQVRHFLLLLDGSRDRVELLRAMQKDFPEIPEPELVDGIDKGLALLQRSGVLLADDFDSAA